MAAKAKASLTRAASARAPSPTQPSPLLLRLELEAAALTTLLHLSVAGIRLRRRLPDTGGLGLTDGPVPAQCTPTTRPSPTWSRVSAEFRSEVNEGTS